MKSVVFRRVQLQIISKKVRTFIITYVHTSEQSIYEAARVVGECGKILSQQFKKKLFFCS